MSGSTKRECDRALHVLGPRQELLRALPAACTANQKKRAAKRRKQQLAAAAAASEPEPGLQAPGPEPELEPEPEPMEAMEVLAAVAPARGRLLLFPHACPHAGAAVAVVPKLFLRGELRWNPTGEE